MPLSDLAKKHYPKTMLSDYHKAMFFDNTGEPAKAQKAFMSAFGQSEILDLTKDIDAGARRCHQRATEKRERQEKEKSGRGSGENSP